MLSFFKINIKVIYLTDPDTKSGKCVGKQWCISL